MPGPKLNCVLCIIIILSPTGAHAGIFGGVFDRISNAINSINKAVRGINEAAASISKAADGINNVVRVLDDTILGIEKRVLYFQNCLASRELPSLLPPGVLAHDLLPKGDDLLKHLQDTLNLSKLHLTESFDVTETIKKDGYTVKNHTIVTEDGYMLTYYRIPCGKHNCDDLRKPPVLIQHGFFTYGGSWIAVEKDDCLPYILADAGYDVWLGNARGTLPSRGHTNDSILDAAYWDFSWEDMGTKDIPAAIDYILQETGFPQLYYIGHSMGTTMAFAGLSMKPEVSEKIKVFFALAPVAWLHKSTTVLRAAAPAEVAFQALSIADLVDLPGEVNEPLVNTLLQKTLHAVCNPQVLSSVVCGNLAFLICGDDFENTNFDALSHLMGKFVSTISMKTLRHFLQGSIRNHFRRYDYGPIENDKRYGNCVPPDYNVTAIKTKTIFIYGDSDRFSTEQEVEKLMDKYNQRFVVKHKINVTHWNHLDFLIANDARTEIAHRIIGYMKKDENLIA